MTADQDIGAIAPAAGTAAWLRHKAAEDPQLIGTATRYVQDSGRSNDAWLKARRYLEHYWETDPACPPPAAEYRKAANELETFGQDMLSEYFRGLADTDAELAAASSAWAARYAVRGDSGAEALLARQLSEGRLWPTADPVLGVDGASYQPAGFSAGPSWPAEPAVLVTTMTTRELVAGFTSEHAASAWLRSRSRAGERCPLADPEVEHLPRLTLEEHVLAWILQQPCWQTGLGQRLRARLWTADCRHEIDAAMRTAATTYGQQAGYREISRELHRRMLRAPGWAADQVGWPFGHWAQGYLEKLAVTRVSEGTARRACQALALDLAPELDARQPKAAAPARVLPAPARRGRLADDHNQQMAALLEESGFYMPRPDEMASRVRITQPGSDEVHGLKRRII